MQFGAESLRHLVDRWLAHSRATHACIKQFGRASGGRWRCVRIAATRPSGVIEIVFFRHGSGGWCVFPPGRPRLAFRTSAC